MSDLALAIVAIAPLALVALLLVVARWPAGRCTPLGFAAMVLVTLLVWRAPAPQLAAAATKGAMVAIEILYIVFASMLLLESLERAGMLSTIRASVSSVSRDRRIQVILVAWLFGSFIEGAAGFGTPAAVCVPLLMGLGFPPLPAAFAGIAIQCTPVSFGAAGTPILLGVSNGLAGAPAVDAYLLANHLAGDSGWRTVLTEITWRAAALHTAIGWFIPLLMASLMTRYFGPNRSFREGLAVWRFALLAAAAMLIPYVLAACLLGPEFPTLLGGGLGFALMIAAARRGWGAPRDTPDWEFAPREGAPAPAAHDPPPPRLLPLLAAWGPYIAVAALLVATRAIAPVKSLALSVAIDLPNLFGSGVGHTLHPLYSPGSIMLAVAMALFASRAASHPTARRELMEASTDSARITLRAATALLFMAATVQVFLLSGGGEAGLPAMPQVLATAAQQHIGRAWPVFAPVLGGVGAAIAGSNTISNMTFALFQFEMGVQLRFDPLWIVALQVVGGAAGNTVCIHNVVAACAVARLSGQEGRLLTKTAVVFAYYILAAMLLTVAALGIRAWSSSG